MSSHRQAARQPVSCQGRWERYPFLSEHARQHDKCDMELQQKYRNKLMHVLLQGIRAGQVWTGQVLSGQRRAGLDGAGLDRAGQTREGQRGRTVV